jgi:4-hydroxymandelate oxidase
MLLNLRDYEAAARDRLPSGVYDYYVGGAGDEATVRENEAAWSRLRIRPRVLVDVTTRDLCTTVLGRPVAAPILTAPAALNALAHPDGELAVARATAALGLIQTLSTMSAYTLEQVAGAARGTRWFQLYVYRDRGLTRALIERAEAAGYAALCVTVDVQVVGNRERDARNPLTLPAGIGIANFAHLAAEHAQPSSLLGYVAAQVDPGVTWRDLAWMRGLTRLPILVKGVLTAADAVRAVEYGCAGIVVSNHGGRQLDTVLPTAVALPEVAGAVAGRAEVFVDGGIRRGTDILKALALGARAVLVGRPYLWGLAVGGEAGVRRVLDLFRDDLDRSLALAGCARLDDVGRELVRSD